ncbi:LytR/AlgR family response regulator transcription factor [Paludibaculum fermentans]|uniref:LytR/AlgR family response regulator transcription factor n=1 Tax=Paludibaculum fermentans TaxID=1473598 RepID=UPI003EB90ABA
MNVLIVDDEPIARQVLRELLEEHPGATLAGEASTGLEAVEQIARLHPDIVLLDLQMPGLDGFSVARTLRGDSLPIVIFVTAFETHALQAFETGAVDYLLKPVRKERLTAALEKARTQIAGLKSQPPPPPAAEPLRRILGRLGADLHMLNPGDVIAFQAEGDTVQIITAQGRYYADHSLRTLESKLPPPQFRRIHRGTIINTDHIRKISPLTSKRWLLKMSNGLEAIVSKRMAGVIRDATHW